MSVLSNKIFKTLISFVAAGCLSALTAESPSIGVVRSNGEFRVDGSTIHGNTTLFNGNLVETASARSVLQIEGVQITLLPESRIKVFRDHVEAGALRIASSAKDSSLQVETTGTDRVNIAARTGSAEVRNSGGVLVAVVRPGLALALDPQAAASTEFRMSGVLESKDGKFFLTDATAKITVEVQGTDLARYVGKTVEVTGSSIPGAPAAAGTSQVVRVATVTVIKAKAGAAAAGSTAAGLSKGATVAIIGGVAVGGTAAGLAAAGTFSSSPSMSAK
jgi:hypothetical protein